MELNKVFFSASTGQVNPVIILEQLVSDGYVLKELRSNHLGNAYYVYAIRQPGKRFLENLPQEYSNNPYGYHIQLLQIDEAKKKEIELLNLEKLKYDVKNSKRIFKTYWYTFAIAIAGLAISLTLLLLRLLGK